MKNQQLAGLVVTLDPLMCGIRNLPRVAAAAARGGAAFVQLPVHGPAWAVVELARRIKDEVEEAGAGTRIIVDDRVDIALAADLDGVFLGPDDLTVPDGRRLMPPGRIIGKGVATLEEAETAEQLRADFIGLGPVLSNPSQQRHPWGLDRVREVCERVDISVVVGGGVSIDNIAEVLATGADAVVVSSAVCTADDPRAAVAELVAKGWGH